MKGEDNVKAFIVYRRVMTFDVSHHPYASTPYIDLKNAIKCVVLAETAREAAEALGLNGYYVEESYNHPNDQRWEAYRTCTIQIPKEVFTLATKDHEFWGGLIRGGYPELLVFDKGDIHLFLPAGQQKVILQIDEVPLIQPALVNA